MVSVVAPLNPDKILAAELSLSSGTFIYLKAGRCNKSVALPGSTSTLCTSKLLMHKVSTSASWCGVMTLDGLMGGKNMGLSTGCIVLLLSGVLMVFIGFKLWPLVATFSSDAWIGTSHRPGRPICN